MYSPFARDTCMSLFTIPMRIVCSCWEKRIINRQIQTQYNASSSTACFIRYQIPILCTLYKLLSYGTYTVTTKLKAINVGHSTESSLSSLWNNTKVRYLRTGIGPTGITKFIVSSCNNMFYIQIHHFAHTTMLNQSLYYTIQYFEPETKSKGGSNHPRGRQCRQKTLVAWRLKLSVNVFSHSLF